MLFVFFCFFFFQAEDGIRDLVRSRGLGDVYKRQLYKMRHEFMTIRRAISPLRDAIAILHKEPNQLIPVSYTHLTLPTSDLV